MGCSETNRETGGRNSPVSSAHRSRSASSGAVGSNERKHAQLSLWRIGRIGRGTPAKPATKLGCDTAEEPGPSFCALVSNAPDFTMLHLFGCSARFGRQGILMAIAGSLLAVLLSAGTAKSQQPAAHLYHQGNLPPGMVGAMRLQRGGPVAGYFQPIEIRAPMGVQVAVAETGSFSQPVNQPARFGMLVGQVYRLRVINIPRQEGFELYPTIEVIDRLYPPAGQEHKFPIVVELHPEDLRLALQGNLVTRVIYVENPQRSLPVPAAGEEQRWFETPPGVDPLTMADSLGRPVAILRIGGRVPLPEELNGPSFTYGSPPVIIYPPEVRFLPRPPAARPGSESSPAEEAGTR